MALVVPSAEGSAARAAPSAVLAVGSASKSRSASEGTFEAEYDAELRAHLRYAKNVMAIAAVLAVAQLLLVALSINLITDGCTGSVSTTSATRFSVVVGARQLTTFLFGTPLGYLSDTAAGRIRLFELTYMSYGAANALFALGVLAGSWELIGVGCVLQGACAPLWPHCIAFVADVSPPDRQGQDMAWVMGVGQYGVFLGAVGFVAISTVLAEVISHRAAHAICYGVASLLALHGLRAVVRRPPASRYARVSPKDGKSRKAWLPLSSFPLVLSNRYLFGQWLVFASLVFTSGGSEVIMVNYLLQRFDLGAAAVLFFLLCFFAITGLGLQHAAPMLRSRLSLKRAVVVSTVLTVLAAAAIGVAPTFGAVFLALPLFALGAPAHPFLMALGTGQVGERDKGELAGIYRSTQALFSGAGALLCGAVYFAKFIEDCSRCQAGARFAPDALFAAARNLTGFAAADAAAHPPSNPAWTLQQGCAAYHTSFDALKRMNATFRCDGNAEDMWASVPCRGGMEGEVPGEAALLLSFTSAITVALFVAVEMLCGAHDKKGYDDVAGFKASLLKRRRAQGTATGDAVVPVAATVDEATA